MTFLAPKVCALCNQDYRLTWNQDGIKGKCSTWHKAIVPQQQITTISGHLLTHYENSFGVNAWNLWNLLLRQVNTITALEALKLSLAKVFDRFPDTPPTKGYTTITNNSLLEWNLDLDHK